MNNPPTAAPTVWIDGHPQLEAIAAAVWERCRTEDTSTVVDDPRNIAVAALAAVLAVLPAGAEDTTTARADALTEAERTMLTYALDQAQEHIWSRDGFTDEDQAAVTSLRRLAAETQPAHSCGNCEGVDPDSCLTNLDRPAVKPQQAVKQTPDTEDEWCKCRSCWGWFVEEHPGEDLDELGRDLGWWSGLPVHRDAPAASAGVQTDEETSR